MEEFERFNFLCSVGVFPVSIFVFAIAFTCAPHMSCTVLAPVLHVGEDVPVSFDCVLICGTLLCSFMHRSLPACLSVFWLSAFLWMLNFGVLHYAPMPCSHQC